jgi:hypothetical protein
MKKEEITSQIETLIMRAAHAEKSDDAMKFSQAACNAANAMCAIQSVEMRKD